jgi:hypothetical protein
VKENGSNSSASETYPVAHALSTPPPSRPKVTIFRGSIADITDAGDVLLSAAPVTDDCSQSLQSNDNWLPVCVTAIEQRPRASPNTYGKHLVCDENFAVSVSVKEQHFF